MTGGRPSSSEGPSPQVDVPYRLAWRTSDVRIGAHRGKIEGAGGLFRDFDLLMRSPDPRRIDLRMSARDPFDTLYVRRFEQKTSISVYALVDLSASMGFEGGVDKMQVVADLAGALAASARRIGDNFGLIGCDEKIIPEFFLPATRSRGGEAEMISQLRSYVPTGHSAEGLLEAAGYVTGRRKLVFVISDFYLPLPLIEALFEALSQHDVVPIVLKDRRELEDLPRYGLISLTDLETGRRRLLAMRPSLRAEWLHKDAEHARALRALAMRYGRPPFEILGPINWDRLGAYLMGEAA
ncbi:MAG TPA: DUF58 domain-containing protein [Methyloceanibacter sp.]|nr:DUF58 domain-containing protein [Methyloceanibacter sp.]